MPKIEWLCELVSIIVYFLLLQVHFWMISLFHGKGRSMNIGTIPSWVFWSFIIFEPPIWLSIRLLPQPAASHLLDLVLLRGKQLQLLLLVQFIISYNILIFLFKKLKPFFNVLSLFLKWQSWVISSFVIPWVLINWRIELRVMTFSMVTSLILSPGMWKCALIKRPLFIRNSAFRLLRCYLMRIIHGNMSVTYVVKHLILISRD